MINSVQPDNTDHLRTLPKREVNINICTSCLRPDLLGTCVIFCECMLLLLIFLFFFAQPKVETLLFYFLTNNCITVTNFLVFAAKKELNKNKSNVTVSFSNFFLSFLINSNQRSSSSSLRVFGKNCYIKTFIFLAFVRISKRNNIIKWNKYKTVSVVSRDILFIFLYT